MSSRCVPTSAATGSVPSSSPCSTGSLRPRIGSDWPRSSNAVNWTYLVAFFLVALVTGEVLSTTALLIEEVGFRRYAAKDIARLAACGLVEALWFRPVMAWWRLKATLLALSGRRPGWGVIPRGEAILDQPADVIAPLTR